MLIQNAVYCPKCLGFLVSNQTHGYVRCSHGYVVDGGLNYSRCTLVEPENDYTISDKEPVDKNKLLWGTKGTYKLLKDLETSHLEAIFNTQTISYVYKNAITDILQDRSETVIRELP